MAQQVNDNFEVLAGIPIDSRNKKATISERDGISSTLRFQGLQCFVEQTQTLYILAGGVANSNWIGIAGANSSNALEVIIDGFYVLSAGKTTILDWEAGDKFRGWIGNRYLVGTILSLPVSLPSDIDNPAKVELAVDSNVINGIPSGLEDTADGIQTSFDIGTNALVKMVFWGGVPLVKADWSQSGTIITITFAPPAGTLMQFI